MVLAVVLGIVAFIALGVMTALLWASSRREDPITESVIAKATTETVITQEDRH